MANTAAVCNSFKTELMLGAHQFGDVTLTSRTSLTAPVKDTFKAALFYASATLSKSTTTYGTSGEVSDASYTAGGIAVTNANAPALSTDTACWTPSASLVWNALTAVAFDCCLIYNSSQSNKAVAVYTFGSQTITAGTFTLTMPANTAGNALLQLA